MPETNNASSDDKTTGQSAQQTGQISHISQPASVKSRLNLIHEITLATLETLTPEQLADPSYVESQVLYECRSAINLENSLRDKNAKIRGIDELLPAQIADILVYSYPIVRIAGAGKNADEDQDMIAIYQFEGPDEGLYVASEVRFRELVRKYNYAITSKQTSEVYLSVMEKLPRSQRCQQENLVAVNNGIFDYETKILHPFTPELIFLTKSRVNYNPNAKNIVIHNDEDGTDWDVESWMETLSDDPEIVNLLWEILGAIIRPLVPWNKSAWFYSNTGNNGKGTLCELMRRLVGDGSYAVIPLADFGKDFLLEPLLRASTIIVDENDVGTYIDKAANIKAVITGDTLSINRKFKAPVAFNFRGFMVQCLNELPRIKDKSDSFFRRQLFIQFTKCFTGVERKYIKEDYLHRQEVLEYVMYRVLNMNYYSLSEPEACKLALDEYKEFNDPVRQFCAEILSKAKWDLLPFIFLYDIYQIWFRRAFPSGKIQNRNKFIEDLLVAIKDDPMWECPDKTRQIASSGRMYCFEPLIEEYGLTDWMNPKFLHIGSATAQERCTPFPGQYNKVYRGLTRKAGTGNVTDAASTDQDTPNVQ